MTPPVYRDVFERRHIYDPPPGSFHVYLEDVIARAKDGVFVKDQISDYIIGVLLLAKQLKVIKTWEGALFQLPFVEGMKPRKGYAGLHYGHPFLGPDGKVMRIDGRHLRGGREGAGDWKKHSSSSLTMKTLHQHPNYEEWKNQVFWQGYGPGRGVYRRTTTNESKKACDDHINFDAHGHERPYVPGPEFTFPPRKPTAGFSQHTQTTRAKPQAVRQNPSSTLPSSVPYNGPVDDEVVIASATGPRVGSAIVASPSQIPVERELQSEQFRSPTFSEPKATQQRNATVETSRPSLQASPNKKRKHSDDDGNGSGASICNGNMTETSPQGIASGDEVATKKARYLARLIATKDKEFDDYMKSAEVQFNQTNASSLTVAENKLDTEHTKALVARRKLLEEHKIAEHAALERKLNEESTRVLAEMDEKFKHEKTLYLDREAQRLGKGKADALAAAAERFTSENT